MDYITEKVKLLHGDCLEVLKELPDNSVDSVVADPPYGLAFMGKKWDYDIPSVDIWRECLRVLKPGGHLLSFAGSRTYHRMTVAIEDAGFEIRDQIMWVYGCLDEQTEVATSDGVKPHHQTKVGDTVLCYNPDNGEYSYQPILEIVEYEYSDTAYRLVGDFGEQVVSRNHRCIVEQDGAEVFVLAEQAARQQQVRVPVLESLPELRQAVSDGQPAIEPDAVCHERTAQGIRAWSGHRTAMVRVVPFHYTGKVWCLRVPTGAFVAVRNGVAFPTGNSGFPKSMDVSRAIDKAAGAVREVGPVDPVRAARLVNQQGSYETDAGWSAGGRKVTIDPPATDAARQWQGWGTALKPSFEPLSFAQKPLTDATEHDTIAANLFILESKLWSLLLANAVETNSTSSQNELSAACAIAQWTVESAINTRAALSGAMGTLPFESATRTSLSIVSSWRRTLAENSNRGNTSITETKFGMTTDWKTLSFCLSAITPQSIIAGLTQQCGLTAFASNAERYFDAELKRLQCTLELSALAPAISAVRLDYLDVDEKVKNTPTCVARKPLIGTVAANVLEHGTGGINIDGCRVGDEVLPSVTAEQAKIGTFERGMMVTPERVGRWPANFIHDGSEEVAGLLGDAARFFYCAKASRKERDEGLDGFELRVAGGLSGRADGSLGSVSLGRNTHPTIKPINLMRYLCRLVTPPGGVVLDPFLGSGSTGVAALAEGFRFIGIEREAEYMAIATARIRKAAEAQ